ncbi:MAG: glycosyltransferase family 39 protein [candidate division WOR-3 bacterium]
MSTTTRFLIFNIILTLTFRSIWTIPALSDINRPLTPTRDAREYETLARNLISVGKFSLDGAPPYRPDALRTPLYPLFAAGVYKVFQYNRLVLILLQIIISTIPIVLIFRLKFLELREKMIAGLLFILNFNIAFYSVQVLSDVIFMVLIFVSLVLVNLFIEKLEGWSIVIAGIFLGLATLTRPIAILLPLFILFYVIIKKGLKKTGLKIILFLMGYLLFILPWLVRNFFVYRTIFFSSVFSYNIASFDAPLVLAIQRKIDVNDAAQEFWKEYDKMAAILRPENINDSMALKTRQALSVIGRYPFTYLKIRLIGFGSTLFLPLPFREVITYVSGKTPEELDLSRRTAQNAMKYLAQGKIGNMAKIIFEERVARLPVMAILILLGALLYHSILIIGCLIYLLCKKRVNSALVLYGIVIIYMLIIPGSLGYSRFRIPIEPMLIIFSSIGLTRSESSVK